MLKTRVIPVLQWDGVQAVKTTQFRRPPRPVGSMMQHVENMQRRGIDELIILDINATRDRRHPNFNAIEQYARRLYCPLTVGGGVSKISHIKDLLNAGADKVAIKTATELIPEACEKFGAQCIVKVVDIRDYETIPTDLDGVGEILLTSVSAEGGRKGYHIGLLKQTVRLAQCPILINGGCGEPAHMLEAVNAGAHAVCASSMFLFTDTTPKDCSRYLHEHGIPARLDDEKFVSDVDLLWEKAANDRANLAKEKRG